MGLPHQYAGLDYVCMEILIPLAPGVARLWAASFIYLHIPHRCHLACVPRCIKAYGIKSKLLSSALLISFFAHTVLSIWNILWTLLYLAILIYRLRLHSRIICFRKPSWKFKFRPMGHLLCLPTKPLAMSILWPDHSPYYQEVVWFCMCRLSQPASSFKTTLII